MRPHNQVDQKARRNPRCSRIALVAWLFAPTAHAAWFDAEALELSLASTTELAPFVPSARKPRAFAPRENATRTPLRQELPEESRVLRATTRFDWLLADLSAGLHYQFADARRFALLELFASPATERNRSAHWQFTRTLDPLRTPLFPNLHWRITSSERALAEYTASLWGTTPSSLPLVRERRCAPWEQPKTLAISNGGTDYDRLSLLDCAGAIAPFALDRISVIARAQGTINPGVPLPDSPPPSQQWPEEWVDGVRLLHPRLLWVVQQIGEAFPRHVIHIMSGYRRDARLDSPHRQGRALDLQVRDVSNEDLFAFCRKLKDVGCGYYPNHSFVHIDVRLASAKSVIWVDISQPGEPSEYVDSWPPVVESGALAGAHSE